MSKPILFHDIDGVLFGEYDSEFQLRPGVKTWLKWAHEHFEVAERVNEFGTLAVGI